MVFKETSIQRNSLQATNIEEVFVKWNFQGPEISQNSIQLWRPLPINPILLFLHGPFGMSPTKNVIEALTWTSKYLNFAIFCKSSFISG